MPEWTIRPATIEDAEQIERFLISIEEFSGTLRKNQEADIWRWQVTRNGRQEASAWLGIDGKGNIIGHYSLIPYEFHSDGINQKACVPELLAVDNAYRNELLAVSLQRTVLGSYAKKDFSLLVAFANRAGLLDFHLAFGFQRIGSLPVMAKPYRLTRVARAVLPSPILYWAMLPLLKAVDLPFRWLIGWKEFRSPATVEIEAVTHFEENIEGAAAYIARSFKHYAVRNAAALNWRFAEAPHRNYLKYVLREDRKVSGYVVLRVMHMKGLNTLAIVDTCFDFEREQAASAVARLIDREALKHGVDVAAVVTSSPVLQHIFKRRLFLKASEKFDLIVHEPGKVGRLKTTALSDWFVTWLDHDYV